MKVYVIVEQVWDNHEVKGVYSSKQRAKQAVKSKNDYIKSFIVNDPNYHDYIETDYWKVD